MKSINVPRDGVKLAMANILGRGARVSRFPRAPIEGGYKTQMEPTRR